MAIEASVNHGSIGTFEQEQAEDQEREIIERVKLNIQEICADSLENTFWVDTRSLLKSLSDQNIAFPNSLRKFHYRTTWIHVTHREEERNDKKFVPEIWKINLDSISGVEYPHYEFSIEYGQEPKVEELIRDNGGKIMEVLRTGVPAPSDLPLLEAITQYTTAAVKSGAIRSTVSVGKAS